MLFLSWSRPSPKNQKSCLDKSGGNFNYDCKYKGATAKPLDSVKDDQQLSKDGFFLNHSRVSLGSGFNTFQLAKQALHNWRHFELDWAFVDPKTRIQNGEKFCVCVKELVPWVMMPLQIVFVNDSRNKKKGVASFGFGSGTLQGHLLAGEERFSVELDENNQVWYEILSLSKPADFLSVIGYPYVRLRQKYFAHQSSNAMLKHLKSS